MQNDKQNMKRQERKEEKFEFVKVMTDPTLLYRSETCVKKNKMSIKFKIFKKYEGGIKLQNVKNVNMQKELDIYSLSGRKSTRKENGYLG